MSFYIELPILLVMFLGWKLVKRTSVVRLGEMDLVTDRFDLDGSSAGPAEGGQPVQVVSSTSRGKDIFGTLKRFGMYLFF